MALHSRSSQKSPRVPPPLQQQQHGARRQGTRQRRAPAARGSPPPPAIDLESLDARWPPVVDFSNETPAQREARLAEEREAKRRNDEIDAQIEVDRTERRKRRPDIRIILLGQAESGKSTILRNFQLKYAPTAFHAEADAWRAVIDLNLVRSVTFLLNLLEECSSPVGSPAASSSSSGGGGGGGSPGRYCDAASGSSSSNGGSGGGGGGVDMRPISPSSSVKLVPLQRLTDDLRRLRVGLSPLRNIEETLTRLISSDYPRQIGGSGGKSAAALPTERAFEVSVRSGSRWKTLFKSGASGAAVSKASSQGYEELQNARRVIEACREDIVALWNHPAVRESLTEQSVSLEFQSGFFLDAVERIAAPGYRPSAADILKARIQTLGVEEHPLRMEIGLADGSMAKESGQLWSIIDVGGSRALRAAWLPYFDDVNVLLFIAPVSAFNQTLTEDRTVNRLWDSFLLWKSLCAHKLLKKATFVLLLNKCDLLEAKLQSGIQFRRFVTSYKDRPNKKDSVLHYLKGKFSAIYRQDPENTRNLHVHSTCATDSTSTSLVLARIRESINTDSFKKASLL
ncbi:guanine nucleotide binding protein, alpha subunit [Russula brevipes]|nr:guanine nucleotide binding protein, alpha subunit [Russula brevipes]